MQKYKILEPLTGLSVIVFVCFLCFYFGDNFFSSRGSVQYINIIAEFDNVDGINKNDEVKISGIRVGYVKDKYLNKENFKATLEIALDGSLSIPSDSSFSIVSSSLMGGKYINVSPGIELDSPFEDGNVALFSQSSTNLESLISKFLFGMKN